MATVNFYLKNPKEKGETLIYLFFRYNGNKLKYSIGEKINPTYWNPEDQVVRKSLTGSIEFNDYLDKIGTTVKSIYRTAITDNIQPTPDYLREQLNVSLQNTGEKIDTFMDQFNEFIAIRKTTLHNRTIQKYNTLKSHLIEFQKKQGTKISFDKVDMKFYEKLIAWFTNDLKLLNNSTGKYITALKSFMHWATDRGYNTNTAFIKFKVPSNEVDIIYLSEKELMKLYNYDFSENQRLEQVRDAFCFGCFTGLRYSDVANLKKENITGDTINLTIQKTKDKMMVPLNDYAKELLEKYDYKLPTITNQKTNKYLKELGKIAGITDSIIVTKFRGAEQIEIKEPKYKLLSSHAGRRTFVTLSLEKGMRPETVMSITGHKEYATFKKYIKLTNKVKLVEMQRVWNKEPELKAVN